MRHSDRSTSWSCAFLYMQELGLGEEHTSSRVTSALCRFYPKTPMRHPEYLPRVDLPVRGSATTSPSHLTTLHRALHITAHWLDC